jgi:cyclophilin family peptidyl-prolyl cis-trans isomerase
MCKIADMKRPPLLCALMPLLLAAAPASPSKPATPAPSPGEIVSAAPAGDWVAIAPSDLLVMDLAADEKGKARRVVIQLMPPPFSQGWIGNIRKLAAAQWWDGTSVNRVQDNYVVQWGDASEKKVLPDGLGVVPDSEYSQQISYVMLRGPGSSPEIGSTHYAPKDKTHSDGSSFDRGWPFAFEYYPRGKSPFNSGRKVLDPKSAWPVHCYGMVGVGRNLSPDTGTGAELYTVIGHAPRHLDRNIALVGRVIEGIEHLSSLPRGTEALGFYKTAEERVTIKSIRMGTEATDLPAFEYLSTESASFAKYADARANRRDAFFIKPAGGADICNIPVPVRRIR